MPSRRWAWKVDPHLWKLAEEEDPELSSRLAQCIVTSFNIATSIYLAHIGAIQAGLTGLFADTLAPGMVLGVATKPFPEADLRLTLWEPSPRNHEYRFEGLNAKWRTSLPTGMIATLCMDGMFVVTGQIVPNELWIRVRSQEPADGGQTS